MERNEKPMGKVVVEIELTNTDDEGLVQAGHKRPEQVRRARLQALVDTGATMLIIPLSTIQQLGLREVRKVNSRIANGQVIRHTIYGPVKAKVMEREVIVEAADGPENMPALLGQIPLEGLDYHVDSKGKRLIPNPESPDLAMIDIL